MLLGDRLLQMLIPAPIPQPKHKTIIHPPDPANPRLNIIASQTKQSTTHLIMGYRIINFLLVLPTCYHALYTYLLCHASKPTI